MNECFDKSARRPCRPASLVSGMTSGTVQPCRGVHVVPGGGADVGGDDVDSVSVVTGVSSLACSRCSYVTGCDLSDSVSNVFATTTPPVSKTRMLITSVPKVTWEEPRRHPSRQRMDSLTACASCTMPTADESNHSAAGTLHPNRTVDDVYRAKFSGRLA